MNKEKQIGLNSKAVETVCALKNVQDAELIAKKYADMTGLEFRNWARVESRMLRPALSGLLKDQLKVLGVTEAEFKKTCDKISEVVAEKFGGNRSYKWVQVQ